ncbi:MAG: AAA family ATPase [Pseudomonadota bacterium]
MYTQFFKLKQSPFSIAPDPRYLFMSERHREALAHLLYGVKGGGGFVLLTGEIGAGKTTVCRCFIEQIPANCKLAYIFNPKLTVEELLLSICDELRIELAIDAARAGAAPSAKTYVDAINGYLLRSHAQGQNNVLVIDEAQNLSAGVLEQLRLLTNLETNERKLLQIVLIGQPELRTMLARPELEQLAQRVIARYHLGSLSAPETHAYVLHRLAVAGAAGSPFPRRVLALVHQLTAGVPRRINLLCDRALLGAYVENEAEVTRAIVHKAAAEVFPKQRGGPARARAWPTMLAGLLAGAAISGAAAWQMRAPAPAVAGKALARAPGKTATPTVASLAGTPAAAGAALSTAPAISSPAAPPAQPLAHPSRDQALRELGALWGQALPAGAPCEAAGALGLRCHQGHGGLYELNLLDRPAVLTLHEGQAIAYAVLVGMDERGITLSVGGKRQVLDAGALAARFDGEYLTMWRAPTQLREQIKVGDHGADVDWLAAQLAQANGQAAPRADTPLGPAMQALLRQFQSRQNLKADGLAGPRTFMRLNQLGGVAEPRLRAPARTEK